MTAPDVCRLLKVGRGCAFPGSRGLEGGGVCWEAPGGLWMELEELVTPVGWGWGGRTPSYTNNLSSKERPGTQCSGSPEEVVYLD